MTTPPTQPPVSGRARDFAIALQRFTYTFSRRWLTIFLVVLGIYVALPILAPILMKAGYTRPASLIYSAYSVTCHQMASRSFFLFGEQNVYPRALAGTDYTPIEAYTPAIPEFAGIADSNWPAFTLAAREFLGNDQLGYKMAICERDIAIYSFLFLGGLLYAGLRRRWNVPRLPFVVFVLIGMGPIGLDGFSQLFGYFAVPPDGGAANAVQTFVGQLFELRESPPWLRFGTGALFGLMLAWLVFPMLDDGMRQNEVELGHKLRRVGAIR